MLVALTCGLPPHVEPLECEDLRGARSLFGEAARVPKPLRAWNEHREEISGVYCSTDCGKPAAKSAYARCGVLWEDCRQDSTADLAEHILESGETSLHSVRGHELSVPALTYIAGSCTSSFAVAWKLFDDGLLPEWGTVICSRQTEGRGQMRRAWHSPRGNMYVTFRLPSDKNLSGDAAALVTGYLLAKAFRRIGLPLSLKWPNDLLTGEGCKVGGILLEERNGVLLAGVGINLVEAPSASLLRAESATRAAILLPTEETERREAAMGRAENSSAEPFAPFALWRSLVSEAILEYTRSVEGKSLPAVLACVDSILAWKGETVTLAEGDGTFFSGRYLGLGEQGGLLLRCTGGEPREIFSGSLSLGNRASL